MKQLIIKTKKRVFGYLTGRHLSKIKGDGLDFRELREYTFNEDAKKIDWKVSAKLQKPMIKEFDEEKELNIKIVLLLSGSMYFGINLLKIEKAIEVASILGFSAVKFDDKVQLILYDKKPILFKPTKSASTLLGQLEKISNIDILKKDYDFYFVDYLNRLKKSIVFIISDFYKIPPLHKLKHETYSIIIRDKFEEDPEFDGFVELIDPINFKEVNVSFNKFTLKKYKNFIQNNDKKLFNYLKSKKIKFTKIYTDEDSFFKLGELIKWMS